MKLENRRAIVTGAAQGLGFAIANRLNAEGCKVAMLDINEEKVCAAAAELKDCFGVKCNVSSADDIAAAVSASRVTVSRVLNEFARQGWLELGYRSIQLCAPEKLLEVCKS